jgi:hypothetical protein
VWRILLKNMRLNQQHLRRWSQERPHAPCEQRLQEKTRDQRLLRLRSRSLVRPGECARFTWMKMLMLTLCNLPWMFERPVIEDAGLRFIMPRKVLITTEVRASALFRTEWITRTCELLEGLLRGSAGTLAWRNVRTTQP